MPSLNKSLLPTDNLEVKSQIDAVHRPSQSYARKATTLREFVKIYAAVHVHTWAVFFKTRNGGAIMSRDIDEEYQDRVDVRSPVASRPRGGLCATICALLIVLPLLFFVFGLLLFYPLLEVLIAYGLADKDGALLLRENEDRTALLLLATIWPAALSVSAVVEHIMIFFSHFFIVTNTYLVPFILRGSRTRVRAPALAAAERLLAAAFFAVLVIVDVEALLWFCSLVDREGAPTAAFTGVCASVFAACKVVADKFGSVVFPPAFCMIMWEVYKEANAMWMNADVTDVEQVSK